MNPDLLQLSRDVIQTEVGSQRRPPLVSAGSFDGAGWRRSGAAATAAGPTAATSTRDTVTNTPTSAPCGLLPAAAPGRRLLPDLHSRQEYVS